MRDGHRDGSSGAGWSRAGPAVIHSGASGRLHRLRGRAAFAAGLRLDASHPGPAKRIHDFGFARCFERPRLELVRPDLDHSAFRYLGRRRGPALRRPDAGRSRCGSPPITRAVAKTASITRGDASVVAHGEYPRSIAGASNPGHGAPKLASATAVPASSASHHEGAGDAVVGPTSSSRPISQSDSPMGTSMTPPSCVHLQRDSNAATEFRRVRDHGVEQEGGTEVVHVPVPGQIVDEGLSVEPGVSGRIQIRGPVPADLEIAGGILVFADESKGPLDHCAVGDDASNRPVVDPDLDDGAMSRIRRRRATSSCGRHHGGDSPEDEGDACECRWKTVHVRPISPESKPGGPHPDRRPPTVDFIRGRGKCFRISSRWEGGTAPVVAVVTATAGRA